MNADQQARQDSFSRATRPEMIRPLPARFTRFGPGYPKRLYRQIKRAYRQTHELNGAASFEFTCTPEFLLQAVDNHRQAQDLLRKATGMPRTKLGARIRAAALNNADVALEVLEVIAHTANRAPALN
ncbi:hypothetical protein DESA109040_05735 [Deinococcus saxicola]|uniref:hypothetical protein n=1 Tax=Deinococcus saxicola TaxID=249406 RepID=UPI0039EDF2CA